MLAILDRRPWLWLALGGALLVATQLTASLGILSWVAATPFLRFLRVTRGLGSRFALGGALVVAWSLAVLKIAGPFPLGAIPMWGVGLALFNVWPYLLHDALRARVPSALGTFVFAAALALFEWAQHTVTPLGSWGATAYTQLDDLPLLQVVAVTGIGGVAFMVGWVAAIVERVLAEPGPHRRRALTALVVVAAVHVGGALRLGLTAAGARPSALVAAIDTEATTSGWPLPSPDQTAAWDAILAERTRRAADAGAVMAVWTEAATLVRPEDEAAWLERTAALARETHLDLVAGYIVPLSVEPGRFENKYVFVHADGSIDHSYLKHHPVPGEPAVAGTTSAPRVAAGLGLVSGAICYDFDFPGAGRERAGVALVALPSSDWRAIDPLHTQMAAVRAIESGFAILRATRFGLSAGIDPEGRIRGWRSHFDDTQGVLLVTLPTDGAATVYATLGDWFVGLAAAFLATMLAYAWRSRDTRRAPVGPGAVSARATATAHAPSRAAMR